MNSTSEFWEKHWQIIAVMVGIIVIAWVAYALRVVLFPFMVGLTLAYITIPLVSWVENRFSHNGRWLRANRISAIAIVYLLIVLVMGVFFFFTTTAILSALHRLLHNSSNYFSAASDTLKLWTESVRQMVPTELRGQMDTYVQEMGDTLLNSVHLSIMNGISSFPSTLGLVLGFAAVPFFLFYILKDREKISGLYSGIPDWASPHVRYILLTIEDSFGRYIRATLMLGLVVGTMTFIGLMIIGAPLAPLLSVLAGVTEIIPMVGPWIGGIIAVMVTLALAPDKVIWVALLFLFVQLLENTLLVPRIQSAYFRIHPAVTIVLLTVGVYIAGVWGLVLTLPLTATVVGIYRYCCQVTPGESRSVATPASTQDNEIP